MPAGDYTKDIECWSMETAREKVGSFGGPDSERLKGFSLPARVTNSDVFGREKGICGFRLSQSGDSRIPRYLIIWPCRGSGAVFSGE